MHDSEKVFEKNNLDRKDTPQPRRPNYKMGLQWVTTCRRHETAEPCGVALEAM